MVAWIQRMMERGSRGYRQVKAWQKKHNVKKTAWAFTLVKKVETRGIY